MVTPSVTLIRVSLDVSPCTVMLGYEIAVVGDRFKVFVNPNEAPSIDMAAAPRCNVTETPRPSTFKEVKSTAAGAMNTSVCVRAKTVRLV